MIYFNIVNELRKIGSGSVQISKLSVLFTLLGFYNIQIKIYFFPWLSENIYS